MDWIEQLLHIAPDHGDGSTERLVATISAVVLIVIVASVPRVRAAVRSLLTAREAPRARSAVRTES